MYIEFTLPNSSPAIHDYDLNRELDNWSRTHNIPYKAKIHKFKKRVTFEDPTTYSFFALTWAPKDQGYQNYLLDYRLIEPMNRV